MKIDTIIIVTASLGIVGVLICVIIHIFNPQVDIWKAFQTLETGLGYLANLAIVAAVLRFTTSETINIEGIGKIKLKRTYNNIQDLTNLISRKFFEGKNFHRTPVLDAFYGNDTMTILEKDPEYEKFSDESESRVNIDVNGEVFSVRRAEIKTLDNLVNAVKYIYFGGANPDNATLKEIYRKWYRVE